MNSTFKTVLEDIILKATGGNRGRTTQTIESWREGTYEDNFNIETEYERQQLIRQVYTIKMRQARKIHTSM